VALPPSEEPAVPYDNIISRADAQAGTTEVVSEDFLNYVAQSSAALDVFRRIPVATNQIRFPVLSALPVAYFVNGDTGLKQTTEANWANKYLNVEEIAAIVPVADAVLDDVGFDIYGEMRPLLTEAIGRTLDAAVFFGTNKPSSWPTAVVPAAVAAGNVYARGTNNAGAGGIAEDINQTLALMEADGFDANAFVTQRQYRARLRGARGTDGQQLLDVNENTMYGVPLNYAMRGMWPTGTNAAELIAMDRDEFVLGVRQDITFKVADQAVIQDNTGAIVYNAFQQDMTFLRVVFRVGWQVRNSLNQDQPTEGSRYPASVLRSPAS
jgi:HK97 family phage major capsid protein